MDVSATASSRRRRLTHLDSVPVAEIRFTAYLHDVDVPAGVLMEDLENGIKNAVGVDNVLTANLRSGHPLLAEAIVDLESASVFIEGAPDSGGGGPGSTPKGKDDGGKGLTAGPIVAIAVAVLGLMLVGSPLRGWPVRALPSV